MIADPLTVSDPRPRWTKAQVTDVQRFWEVYDTHFEEINKALAEHFAGEPQLGPLMASITADGMDGQNREALRDALLNDQWKPYLEALRRRGESYALQGITFRQWINVVSAFRVVLAPFVLEERRDDLDRLSIARGVTFYTDIAMAEIGQAYLEAKERQILDQQDAIRDLSTPVLELSDGLLLMPIVGMIDTDRARRLTESLLEGIAELRARVVVMDLTGVPTMDTAVANHLMQTVSAARLMGATALVTGISAENAQTLVRLGPDLSQLDTIGSLMVGLEHADRLLGRARQE
jgi:rsbT co-antagonist protein RsbR